MRSPSNENHVRVRLDLQTSILNRDSRVSGVLGATIQSRGFFPKTAQPDLNQVFRILNASVRAQSGPAPAAARLRYKSASMPVAC